MTKQKSSRADGLGHWPRGKRRHADAGDWERTRRSLARLLKEPVRGVVSRKALARAVGVTDTTVARWLSGEDRPAETMQEAVRRWVDEKKGETR